MTATKQALPKFLFTPISPAARTLAWMEAITGQFYLGVIVAGLVSIIVANNSRIKPADS